MPRIYLLIVISALGLGGCQFNPVKKDSALGAVPQPASTIVSDKSGVDPGTGTPTRSESLPEQESRDFWRLLTSNYRLDQIVGWEVVERTGGKVMTLPVREGRSTSGMIHEILRRYGHTGRRG